MIKMYPGKYFRGRRAVRSAAVAFAFAGGANHSPALATETTYIFTGNGGAWSASTSWSAMQSPQTGWVADIFRGVTVNYNLVLSTTPATPVLGEIQIAGGTSSAPAELILSTASGTPYLETNALVLGGSYTGQSNTGTSTGPGEVAQSAGSITIDPGGLFGGLFQVDPTSIFALSGSGSIIANNEILSGTFSESGNGANALTGGSVLANSGTYTLSGGINSADIINNTVVFNASTGVTYTGVYNQSGGTVQGTSAPNFNFSNNAAYIYSGGTFLGTMNNNVGATININSATIPFAQGLVNNGRTTVTGGTGTYAGPISGNGPLIFNGATSITLTGTSTFTGPTTISAGTVILAGPVGINGSGGSINGNVGISSAGTLQTNTDSQIANTSLITVNGGTLNLNTHDETLGTLNMTAGHVTQASGQGLGVASGQIIINKGSSSITGGLRSSVPLNFNVSSNATLTVGGNISGYNSATAAMVLTGGGGLTISATSILASIDIQQGILQISEGGNFANANPTLNVETAGTLSIGSQVVTTGDLMGGGEVSLGTGSLNVNSSGSTFAGTLIGSGSFIKMGPGTLTLAGNDASTGITNVSSGTLTVATSGSIAGSSINVALGTTANFNGTLNSAPNINALGTLNFGANPGSGILARTISALTIGSIGQVNVFPATTHSNRVLLVASGVTMVGTTGAWSGQLDLANNDLVVHNGSLSALTDQIKSGFAQGQWNGSGIISSSAAADTNHLTALGVILNDDGTGNPLYGANTSSGTFDGVSASATDVLVKFTYYGDANLDGKVDASDYSRIDSTFVSEISNGPISGWYNGDFNYDGVVNGSDYTLIDNAFNTQGSNLSTSAEIAGTTSEIARTAAVPEPAFTGASVVALAMLARRRRGN